MSERREVVIRAQCTEAQALALQIMVERWNRLGGWGSSRFVAFYADGDGNFHPKATIEQPPEFRSLTDDMRKHAEKLHTSADPPLSELYLIDFDPIAWRLRETPQS